MTRITMPFKCEGKEHEITEEINGKKYCVGCFQWEEEIEKDSDFVPDSKEWMYQI